MAKAFWIDKYPSEEKESSQEKERLLSVEERAYRLFNSTGSFQYLPPWLKTIQSKTGADDQMAETILKHALCNYIKNITHEYYQGLMESEYPMRDVAADVQVLIDREIDCVREKGLANYRIARFSQGFTHSPSSETPR